MRGECRRKPGAYFESRFCPYLLMPNRRIFESRVWRGIPSFAAAPEGPAIRPWLSARAASIISISRSAKAGRPSCRDDSADSPVSQLSSTMKVSACCCLLLKLVLSPQRLIIEVAARLTFFNEFSSVKNSVGGLKPHVPGDEPCSKELLRIVRDTTTANEGRCVVPLNVGSSRHCAIGYRSCCSRSRR